MNEKREVAVKFRVGIFVLVALLTFLGAVYALGARARLFEARYTIHADFTEVGGLVEGATVRLAGVQIGRVSAVNLPPQPGGKVQVDLTIARRFSDRIRKNSVARIETQGLLGDRIVEITVGDPSAPAVAPGEVLASRDPADFGRIMASGAETAKNVAALADALRETADQINKSKMIESAAATVNKLGRVVDQVEQGRGWAHTLLYEEPVALKRLNELIASTQTVIDRVEKGQGAAGVLVSPEGTASAKRFVAAMDRISAMVEQPEREPGLLPGLLFDPKYKAVLDDLRVVSHNLRVISDRVGRQGHARQPGRRLGRRRLALAHDARSADRRREPQIDQREDQRGRRHGRAAHRRPHDLRAPRHDSRRRPAELPAALDDQEPRRQGSEIEG